MSTWVSVKLGQIATFATGKLNSNAASPDGAYPFFTCSRQTLRTGTYSFNTEAVLLAGNNAEGIYPIKFHRGKFDAYQRTYVIRSKDAERLHNRYLFYALQPSLGLLRSISTGAATKFLTLPLLSGLDLRLPPVLTQRKIAAVLSAYDDLIESNLRRIAILEEMAQALYREWFVEFRFPGHENARFVEAANGRAPTDWALVPIPEAVCIDPPTTACKSSVKPHVLMAGLAPNSMIVTPSGTRAGLAGSRFVNGDTLMARITPCLENGKTGYVQFLSEGEVGLGSTEFIVLRSRTLTPEYVYFMARSEELRGLAIKSMTGASGRQRVQKECFDGHFFAHPDPRTLGDYTRSVRPMFSLIHVLARQNTHLRATRDLLLPKLISGELDVSELDIEVPAQ